MKKISNIAAHIVLWCCLALLLTAFIQRATGTLVPTIFGWGMVFVENISLEPEIPQGSVILIHNQDSYRSGDVVTYIHSDGEHVVTQRITSIDDTAVATQGNANDSPGSVFPPEQIVGRVVLAIPFLAYIFSILHCGYVLAFLVILAIILLILDYRSEKSEIQGDLDAEEAIELQSMIELEMQTHETL